MSRALEERAKIKDIIRERYFIFVRGVLSKGRGESQECMEIHCGEVMLLCLSACVASFGAPRQLLVLHVVEV